MAKVKSTFACPGCERNNGIVYAKPKLTSPSVVKFTCMKCESGVMAIVKRKSGAAEGAVEVQLRLTSISEPLRKLWDVRIAREKVEAEIAAAKEAVEAQGEQKAEV